MNLNISIRLLMIIVLIKLISENPLETTNFFQSDYNLTHDRLIIVDCDKDYIELKVKNFKYNRTIKAMNWDISVMRDLSNNLTLRIQAYKFASNEYRLFPITFTQSFCKMLTENRYGFGDAMKCGNFTGCPLLKGHYQICNWTIDGSKFPPHVPQGDYMIDLNLTYFSTYIIARYQWYCKVEKRFRYV